MKHWVFLMLCILGPSAWCESLDRLEQLYGPGDLATVSGNGGLTVGLSRRGRINLCRWPSPSYNDQLSYRTVSKHLPDWGVQANHGAMWGLRQGDAVTWLGDDSWELVQDYESFESPVMKTTAVQPDTKTRLTQTVFVDPERDVFVCRIAVDGLEEAPTLYWYANFTPCTRKLPEFPVADWAFDDRNDFAAFALPDKGRLFHFRPAKPGAIDYEQARRLASKPPHLSTWTSFQEGVWIGVASPDRIEGLYCGIEPESPGDFVRTMEDGAASITGAAGQTASLVRLKPRKQGHQWVATVYVAIGADHGAVSRLLDEAEELGGEAILQSTRAHWRDYLSKAAFPSGAPPSVRDFMTRSLLLIATCTDRNQGAIVRSPATQPSLARDWPRHGAWMNYALDRAGFHDQAGRHARFYQSVVRQESRPGKPKGSLPASVYADGVEASPHVLLDTGAVAWTLWAYNSHASFLERNEARGFLAEVWEAVASMGDFLVLWADDRSGAPLYDFDPVVFRETQNRDELVLAHMGIESALEIARALGRAAPKEWEERKRDLDVLVRSMCLDPALAWRENSFLPFSLRDVLPLDDPRLDMSVQWRLSLVTQLQGYMAAKSLCELAMLWRGEPERLESLRPLIPGVLRHAMMRQQSDGSPVPAFPDALSAALCYTLGSLVYDSGR